MTVLPPVESKAAETVTFEIGDPVTLDWAPGAVTERLSTFQFNVMPPAVPADPDAPPAPPATVTVGAVE